MTSFYLKTDLDVAGPFTGIEIREAALAGIIRPSTLLAGTAKGPWVAAEHAGLFSETGVALPHPPGTVVPVFQTRGMPGAFMGPFKLRELIGFACQGMLPPGTELQSDPARPWIPITGTGILPACLRGELVRIQDNGRLCLRTVIPSDLDRRRCELETMPSPIQLARKIKVSGATAAPSRTRPNPNSAATHSAATHSATSQTTGTVQGTGGASGDHPVRSSLLNAFRNRAAGGWAGGWADWFGQPKLAAAVLLVATLTIGLPVAYSSWTRSPIPRQAILGDWIVVTNTDDASSPIRFGIGFHDNGTCVLADPSGVSWTGDFRWASRTDQSSGFRPTNQLAVRYDTAEPGHVEGAVIASDGYLRLTGFVKEPPLLDGHPVRELWVRRTGDDLKVGYLTESRWDQGRQELIAAWVDCTAVPANPRSMIDVLREMPEEPLAGTDTTENAKPIGLAIDHAIEGRQFEYKNQKAFRNGCFVRPGSIDAAYLLKHFGVPDVARPLRDFEKQLSYNGPSMDEAQLLRYDAVSFFVDLDGTILFIEIDIEVEIEVDLVAA